MGETREMYPQLFGDLDTLPDTDIEKILEEIISGSSVFGPFDEWIEWYHYLLPRLILRDWELTYYNPAELLFTAFIAQHPASGGDIPYAEFRQDALATLGRYIMSPGFWLDGRVDARKCLSKWRGPAGIANWSSGGGLLSAALFFCIKYVDEADIAAWFRSVIAIDDPFWTIQLVTWLTEAYPILAGTIRQPADLSEDSEVRWTWSHTLDGNYTGIHQAPIERIPFLPSKNRAIVFQLAHDWDVDAFLEEFMTDPKTQSVASEVVGIPERFLQLYRTA